MNKFAIIGAIAVIGGGAYLFYKNKDKAIAIIEGGQKSLGINPDIPIYANEESASDSETVRTIQRTEAIRLAEQDRAALADEIKARRALESVSTSARTTTFTNQDAPIYYSPYTDKMESYYSAPITPISVIEKSDKLQYDPVR